LTGSELFLDLEQLGVGPGHAEAIRAMLLASDGSQLSLARFQADAVMQVLRSVSDRADRGIVIGAGTGAGKTKAFYIPALAEIAASLTAGRWVRALAIYPRVELLKDQLAEAYSEVGKLDNILKSHGRRAITIGAYYGDTPSSAETLLKGWQNTWNETAARDGWVCPYFICPDSGCREREMYWTRADVVAEASANQNGEYGSFAQLRCRSCGCTVDSDHFVLTREQMIRQPPDLLFTTTEMLNRRLSRAREHALFGIDSATPPRLVLLDEIHTYEGLNGAQVAYLLRRYRHARSQKNHQSVCIVGLSATLTQAEDFFARLTGIPLHQISYIYPRSDDLVEEGVEYNVALKGDPASATSLLSTSVQTAMLLGRILDPSPSGLSALPTVSKGAYGQRIFAFTDKLDVINRWYSIEQSAEVEQGLGKLRLLSPNLTPAARQVINQAGQDWWVCTLIGHDLRAPLRLGLTSSQYRGVRATADLVIATSTLEVGFNDPTIGAILQHKAPRSLASFLQRKGRAGRTRSMRPWMVVVTSEYGRDRWAFQHTENLFSPTLPPIELPIENYYVRKIQAAFALMDWLALTLKRDVPDVDVWDLLSSDVRHRSSYLQSQRLGVAQALRSVLDGPSLGDLTAYLRRALGMLDGDVVINSVLWDEPRPLLLEVIPVLMRQLESNWQSISQGQAVQWGDVTAPSPMPDFVPPSLFSDLNLPELLLRIPETTARPRSRTPTRRQVTPYGSDAAIAPPQIRSEEFMPLLQGLVEFAPGNVSKRFSRRDVDESHWLALPAETELSRGMLPLQYLAIEREDVPTVLTVDGVEYQIYRPRTYTLGVVPRGVQPTSNARFVWRSHFAAKSKEAYAENTTVGTSTPSAEQITGATNIALARGSPWSRILTEIKSYTQGNGSWVDVTRLATQVRVSTTYVGGREERRVLRLEEGGAVAALGFTIAADALAFKFEALDVDGLVSGPGWPDLYRRLGPEYFLYMLKCDVRLAEAGLSMFEIAWLWQLELSMLVATAVARHCSLAEAAEEVQRNRVKLAARTLGVIFQVQQFADNDEEESIGRLQTKLARYLESNPVREALSDNSRVLWTDDDPGLKRWLHECYASSLGAALFATASRLVPDIEPDDLVLDVEGNVVWISEFAAGGVGLVSKIADTIALRPGAFDLQLRDVLEHCQRGELAWQLSTIAALVRSEDQPLADVFAQVRSASDLPRQETTRGLLSSVLERHGLPAGRDLVVALNAKFLRPNSGPDSDRLIATLVHHWHQEEERIGCSIDLRVMAVVANQIQEVRDQLQELLRRIGGDSARLEEAQVFNLLQSMLWLRCETSCLDCIEHQHPFQEFARPSRDLLLALVEPGSEPVGYGQPNWEELLRERLSTDYHVDLICSNEVVVLCKQAILDLLVRPVDVGFQHFFPSIGRIRRDGRRWLITLALHELARD
jgi:DEAD/DEAH box helicase